MKRFLLVAVLLVSAPALASAQIHQVSSTSTGNSTVNFTVGYFALKGLDLRVSDDVLAGELLNAQPLLFEVKDFNGAPISGEYLYGFGSRFEAGVGLGYFQRTVHSVYANLTYPDGTEIQQDLKLRMVPVTFTGRFLLLPRGSAIEPYVGGGVVAIKWRYSETGDFVDVDNTIFPASYVADGTAVGPTILGGARFPFGPVVAGGEVRWQKAEGDVPVDAGLLGTKLDLGGWTANFTLGVRF